MQSIILAAGCGARMRPLTDHTHKTLLRIDGDTLIGRLLEALQECGVRRVLIVTGHEAAQVETHLQDRFPGLQLRFVRNEQYATTNNIVSLALAFEHVSFDEDLLLVEADLVMDVAVLKRLVESPHPNAALLDRHRPGMDGTVVTVEDGIVSSVIPPHLQSTTFDFSDKFKTLNVYKFSAEFCRSLFAGLLRYYAQTVDGNCYYELILGILIYLKKARIHAVLVQPGERWSELDDPVDLRVTSWTFEPEARRTLLEEAMGGYWSFDVLDFCFLRNMYFPTPAILSELRRHLPDLIQNYGSAQTVLDRKLSWWLLCRPERVVALNGLSQVFPWLARRLSGQRVLLPRPTFGEYTRLFPHHLAYADPFHLDLAVIEDRLAETDVCVIVSPNNPTGSEVPTPALHALIARHPDRLFLVDASFDGFSEEPSLLRLLEAKPLANVLLLSSLSKTLGVPGLRLGFAYSCNADWLEALRKDVPIWNLSGPAENFLEIILKHRQSFETSLVQTRRDRAAFATALRACPAVQQVVEGGGNFVVALIKPEAIPPGGVVDHLLKQHSSYVKDVSAKITSGQPAVGPSPSPRGSPDCWLRLAVRSPEENTRLVNALTQMSGISMGLDNLRMLMAGTERLLELLERERLTAWFDWGALLGWHRQRNLIPWDTDVDLCMMQDDYAALLRLFAKNGGHMDGLIARPDYYGEPESCCCIVFQDNGGNDAIGIDIVAYREEGDWVRSLMSAATVAEYPAHYDFRREMLLPLRRELLLGRPVWVPCQAEERVHECFGREGWKEFPPGNFASLLTTRPFREVRSTDWGDQGVGCSNAQPVRVTGAGADAALFGGPESGLETVWLVPETEAASGDRFTDLVFASDLRLWGKVIVCTLRLGESLVVPEGWRVVRRFSSVA
jgi:histidinol-phosphate/aromatic aminotransferase/cobyric acid decarboxylase-like protein/GTP:adenosylcobinamide-phosphate guanylyltransferase